MWIKVVDEPIPTYGMNGKSFMLNLMKKFVALFEGWNDKHDHECMCYVVDVNDDFESILSVEEQAEKMARSEYPNLKNFETLYIKELLNR